MGGGTAGLAIAARLAEDSTTTIAVIEGGGTGDEVIERILARRFSKASSWQRNADMTC